MSTRTEREKNKRQHDKHMSILMELLREDQNKYCADCRSKGPRWASWNLGIFVCITCAGIHRNLGVHISRVKSVNLDAWTPEQIKNMQEWGNKRAAEYYEYHLPDGFRRPQSDSGLEGFIRNKYEKKLYISKDGPPPAREVKSSPEKTSKEKKKSTDINIKKPRQSNSSDSKPAKNNTATKDTMISRPATTAKVESATADLLSLSEPTATQNNTLLSMASVRQPQDNTADLLNFGGSSFQSATNNPAPPASTQTFGFDLSQPTSSVPVASANQLSANPGVPSSGQSNLEEDLFKEDFSSSGGQSTKDTIMALYQPSQKQASPQMFGVPGGVYLQQQQQQQPQGGVSLNRPNTMAPQYNPQYNAQQQQMYQVNQVQQQMAKLGFAQAQTNQAMPNNRAVPNSQVMPGYNFNQTVTGMPPYNNAPAPYGNTPLMNGGTPMMNGGWMAQRPGNFPQQQAMPQYLTTGPTAPGFNMYQGRGGMPAGQTLSNNLWK